MAGSVKGKRPSWAWGEDGGNETRSGWGIGLEGGRMGGAGLDAGADAT